MTGFAYFDGEKWVENLAMKDIRALAMSGVITESTLIRNPDGQEKEARFCGLFFSDTPPQTIAGLKTDDESITEDESIMQPAISLIKVMIVLLAIGATITIVVAFFTASYVVNDSGDSKLGWAIMVQGFQNMLWWLFVAACFFILKYFLMCFDSMEQTFRRIEKNTRKDNQIQLNALQGQN